MKEISYEINEEFGSHVIEERNNTVVMVRRISWNGHDEKLDIRKYVYTEDGEKMGKGIGLTDEGTNELVSKLISLGYGTTESIIDQLAERTGSYDELINAVTAVKNKTTEESDEYYNPKELLTA
jgi:hypothetical protein